MTFMQIYLVALMIILFMMTLLWLFSVYIKNAGIVDMFWGIGFVITCFWYFFSADGYGIMKILLLIMVAIWGLRLSAYLTWRNWGKGEDFRYREFRRHYGESRYWWISFFQVFMLQGIIMWLVSAPLLGAQFYSAGRVPGILDLSGILVWIIGLIFEAGGDMQLSRFKADPENKGKVLTGGLWRYTRHPNYFGDAAVWWGFGLICLSSGTYLPVLGVILMTALIIKVSGVVLLEKTMIKTKPQYENYVRKTNSFIRWFPGK